MLTNCAIQSVRKGFNLKIVLSVYGVGDVATVDDIDGGPECQLIAMQLGCVGTLRKNSEMILMLPHRLRAMASKS